MSELESLPPDLASLELALAASAPPLPDMALGHRVLNRTRTELIHSQRREFWAYAAATAACILLALNVTLAVTRGHAIEARLEQPQARELCEQVNQMHLGLSDQDIQRLCILNAAGSRLLSSGRPLGQPAGHEIPGL